MLKEMQKKIGSKLLSYSVRRARSWSNELLRLHAPLISGSVLNVSGWRDEDKQGKRYREYFLRAASYTVSNYEGWRGLDGGVESLVLDLAADLHPSLIDRFDCVFNHTTIEHIFEVKKAFANICQMSRDAVIIVAPASQPTHGPEDGDFWRFTPYAMRRLLAQNGFTILHEDFGPRWGVVKYLYYFAARDPKTWEQQSSSDRELAVERSRQLAI